MRMARHHAPPDLFADIVNSLAAVDFNLIGGFGPLHGAFGLLAGRHDESVIAARTDSCHIVAADNRPAEQRGRVMIRTIDVNDRLAGRRARLVERTPLHGTPTQEYRTRHQCRYLKFIVHGEFEPACALATSWANRSWSR